MFHHSRLTDGVPPNDRGCRICGKIGHIVKECPRKISEKNTKLKRRIKREAAALAETSPRRTPRKPLPEELEFKDQGAPRAPLAVQSKMFVNSNMPPKDSSVSIGLKESFTPAELFEMAAVARNAGSTYGPLSIPPSQAPVRPPPGFSFPPTPPNNMFNSFGPRVSSEQSRQEPMGRPIPIDNQPLNPQLVWLQQQQRSPQGSTDALSYFRQRNPNFMVPGLQNSPVMNGHPMGGPMQSPFMNQQAQFGGVMSSPGQIPMDHRTARTTSDRPPGFLDMP